MEIILFIIVGLVFWYFINKEARKTGPKCPTSRRKSGSSCGTSMTIAIGMTD